MSLKTNLQPKTNKGLQTKMRLLKAAERVFGENGFHRAGVTDITRQANMSLGAFYTYFESKEQIYEELVLHMQKEMRRYIKSKTIGIENRIELEREGFKAFFEFLQSHEYLYRLFRQAEYVNEDLYKKYFETFSQGYMNGLRESMEKGEIKRFDPEMITYCLMGITDYLGMRWVIWDKKEITDEMIDELMNFLENGIAHS